jgi:hypothetical protein
VSASLSLQQVLTLLIDYYVGNSFLRLLQKFAVSPFAVNFVKPTSETPGVLKLKIK